MSKHRAPSRMAVTCAAVLTVSGLAAVGAVSTQPAAAAVAGYQNIRINELSSDNSEVELYNLGTTPVDLTSWKVGTNSAGDLAAPKAIGSLAGIQILPGGFVTFFSPDTFAATGDTVMLFADDGTTVDRVDFAAGSATHSMARCGGDGFGSFVTQIASTFGTTNTPACSSVPDASKVRINEVTSAGNDTVELVNNSANPVNVSSWKFVDNDVTHTLTTLPSASINPTNGTIAAGKFLTWNSSSTSIGLGGNDSVFLVDGNGNTIDGVSWASGAALTSYERCPGVPVSSENWFQSSSSQTFGTGGAGGAANSCTAGGGSGGATLAPCGSQAPSGTALPTGIPQAWPGPQTASVVDNQCEFLTPLDGGMDMSGLAFDPVNPGTLWAIQNKEWLWKLTKVGGKWVPDATWSATGKEIFFKDVVGGGLPDTEGLTVGGNGNIYVTSERDNANNTIPKDTIMEFDPNATTPTLTPLRQYDVTAQFPQLTNTSTDANLGFEGVGFVPDSWLVDNRWTDPLTGKTYNPANYPLHGSGLFFAGFEKDGTLHIYGLNSDGTTITFGALPTGQVTVVDVMFDYDTQRIVATCDNACSETHTFMKIDHGQIVPDVVYRNPTSMPIDNLEGFAIAPPSTCVNGTREAVFADDGNYGNGPTDPATTEHALWSATFPC